MDLRHRQNGMTLIGMLFVMMVVIGSALAAMRIAPMYMNNMTVRGALESLVSDVEMRGAPTTSIKKKLQRLFDVNDIKAVNSKSVAIKRVEGGREVRIKYEARAPLVSNLDVVGSFDEWVVVPER
jgi:hypothetical protein